MLRDEIYNYGPIVNLYAASKIFEKWILQRIGDIEKEMNVDLTG